VRQRKSIPASLQHLVFIPNSAGRKFPTIIASHGRGAEENDLVPLTLALDLSDVILITPRAPFAFPYGGYAWYNLGQEAAPDPETFRTSLKLFQQFVSEVKTGYPVDPERLLLLGFSQGTVISYAAVLLDPPSFRGVAALSGYVPQRSGLRLEMSKLTGFPVFISHGSNDPMIPVQFGRESAELLKRAGADVTYHEYSMGHEVTEDTMHDLKQWLRNRLTPS